jgi:hypothetical protein
METAKVSNPHRTFVQLYQVLTSAFTERRQLRLRDRPGHWSRSL